ncbi:MAG: non-ribosomal peptide synthetase, partial [Tumebacillaceae bacterium]
MRDKISENAVLFGEKYEQERHYWQQELRKEMSMSGFPLDAPRRPARQRQGEVVERELSATVSQKLFTISNNSDIGLYLLLLAGVQSLLHPYIDSETSIVGMPVLTQGKQTEYINNILAIRNDLHDEMSFRDVLLQVREKVTAANKHRNFPFAKIAELLEWDRPDEPLVKTIVLLDAIHDKDMIDDIGADLVFAFCKRGQSISLQLEFNAEIYQKQTIERIAAQLSLLFETVTAAPDTQLSRIDLVTVQEREQLLQAFNNTSVAYDTSICAHELFERQALEHASRTALVFGDQTLTYAELDAKVNQLATRLREKGVQPNQIVGLMVDRSLEMVISLLAVLKAGGAFVPIDPTYPMERILYMLEDSDTQILLTQKRYLEQVSFAGESIAVDEESVWFGAQTAPLSLVNTAQDLAYVLYTSGSTGKPKGVMIGHRSLHNFVHAMAHLLPLQAGSSILALTTISFDIFMLETIGALCHGMRVVIANEEEQIDPALLQALIARHQVDILQATPSRIQLILSGDGRSLAQVKHILMGGEAISAHLIDSLRGVTQAKLYNGYGPTEATVYTVATELIPHQPIVIGKPMMNTRAYVVDKHFNLLPIGMPGELCLSGDSLALGYLKRPELTAEKFVDNPFEAGRKMYRTGDLVRWLPDGTIDYLGRIDQQVKIRGYRIELGEIETWLRKHAEVQEAVVVAHNEGSDRVLGAYVVAADGFDVQSLHSYLATELPSYMIPSYFIDMESLPLTPSGKVDRKALPLPTASVHQISAYKAPVDEVEKKMASYWAELLGLERVGVLDNFFAIGGHSLRAAMFVSWVKKEFQVNLPMTRVFENPTIQELAVYLREADVASFRPIEVVEKRDVYPVSSAQKQMLVLQEMENTTSYNMPNVLVLTGALELERFEQALQALIDRHDAFRTSFDYVDGVPMQRVHDHVPFHLTYKEIREEDAD